MGSAIDSLAVQAPLLVVLLFAISGLFAALQKINNGTIEDLRKRLDGQDSARTTALNEMKDAIKDIGHKIERIGERLAEKRGGE